MIRPDYGVVVTLMASSETACGGHSSLLERIGHCALVMRDNKDWLPGEHRYSRIGLRGGVEMFVPVIVVHT